MTQESLQKVVSDIQFVCSNLAIVSVLFSICMGLFALCCFLLRTLSKLRLFLSQRHTQNKAAARRGKAHRHNRKLRGRTHRADVRSRVFYSASDDYELESDDDDDESGIDANSGDHSEFCATGDDNGGGGGDIVLYDDTHSDHMSASYDCLLSSADEFRSAMRATKRRLYSRMTEVLMFAILVFDLMFALVYAPVVVLRSLSSIFPDPSQREMITRIGVMCGLISEALTMSSMLLTLLLALCVFLVQINMEQFKWNGPSLRSTLPFIGTLSTDDGGGGGSGGLEENLRRVQIIHMTGIIITVGMGILTLLLGIVIPVVYNVSWFILRDILGIFSLSPKYHYIVTPIHSIMNTIIYMIFVVLIVVMIIIVIVKLVQQRQAIPQSLKHVDKKNRRALLLRMLLYTIPLQISVFSLGIFRVLSITESIMDAFYKYSDPTESPVWKFEIIAQAINMFIYPSRGGLNAIIFLCLSRWFREAVGTWFRCIFGRNPSAQLSDFQFHEVQGLHGIKHSRTEYQRHKCESSESG